MWSRAKFLFVLVVVPCICICEGEIFWVYWSLGLCESVSILSLYYPNLLVKSFLHHCSGV